MEVVKKEVVKWLEVGIVYPIQCVPKRGGMIVVANEENKLISTRIIIGWRACMDYL